MNNLNWLEKWALRLLHRSPRVGLVIVQPYMGTEISWSVAQDDEDAKEIAAVVVNHIELEPPCFRLERVFHMPAYGEDE